MPLMLSSSPSSEATRHYRSAKPLPTQLLDHCTVCLEEQLYSQALALLSGALTAGTGTSHPARIPPTQHLGLAATLIVHPSLTTRTTSEDKHVASDDALRYLKHVNQLAGPRHGVLSLAFQFREKPTVSRSKRGKTRNSNLSPTDSDEDDKPGHIRSSLVSKDSLWTNAEDFWGVVGWALNCSIAHRTRWPRWKLLLDFMLDVLEDDLSLHAADQTAAQSLIAQYLRPIGEGRNNKRRLMRAILANGKQKSLAEFGEIWRNETKPPKRKDDDKKCSKKRKLDLENGDFGDYFDDESDADSPAASSMRRSRSATAMSTARTSRQVSDLSDNDSEDDSTTSNPTVTTDQQQVSAIDALGDIESIHLRRRLLTLLIRFCTLSSSSFLDTEDLFDLFTEFLRPLPLPVFQQFVLPSKRYLDPHVQSSLDQMLLRPLLSSTAPTYNENALTQGDFETYYAPYAANVTSVVENAKVSLLIEDLMRLLWRSGRLVCSETLRKAVEEGIKARKVKVGWDGRKKSGGKAKEEEEAWVVLEASAGRMAAVLEMC